MASTFSVVNNIASLNALNRLARTNLGLNKTLQRLSSGLRINSAADDASGLAIADGLRADVAALNTPGATASVGAKGSPPARIHVDSSSPIFIRSAGIPSGALTLFIARVRPL